MSVDSSLLGSDFRLALVAPLPPPVGGLTIWTQDFLAAAEAAQVSIALVDTSPHVQRVEAKSRLRWYRVRQGLGAFVTLRRALKGASLAHLTCTWHWSLLREGMFAWICARRGVPVVLNVHASTNIVASVERYGKLKRHAVRALLRPVTAFVVLSEELGVALGQLVEGRPTYVVPNWVDADLFVPGTNRSKTDRVRVLFVGRLMAEKGFLELAKAVLADDRIELISIGDWPGGPPGPERAEIELLLDKLARTGRHVHHPSLGRDAIATEYRNADVFCLPSWNEGLPVALLEAMAAGLPCVVSRVGGMGDLINQAAAPFAVPVAPRDEAQLARALAELCEDPDRRRALGDDARALALDRFSRSVVFGRFLEIYLDLAATS